MNCLNLLVDIDYHFRFKKEFNLVLNAYAKFFDYQKPIIVDVLITDNKHIKKISNNYRNINKETDVLSFPFENKNYFDDIPFIHLGEIVLSYEKIKKQALEFNHSIKREFCFLFAHGLVHLAGLDHKKSPTEEKEFNEIVYNIMNQVNINR